MWLFFLALCPKPRPNQTPDGICVSLHMEYFRSEALFMPLNQRNYDTPEIDAKTPLRDNGRLSSKTKDSEHKQFCDWSYSIGLVNTRRDLSVYSKGFNRKEKHYKTLRSDCCSLIKVFRGENWGWVETSAPKWWWKNCTSERASDSCQRWDGERENFDIKANSSCHCLPKTRRIYELAGSARNNAFLQKSKNQHDHRSTLRECRWMFWWPTVPISEDENSRARKKNKSFPFVRLWLLADARIVDIVSAPLAARHGLKAASSLMRSRKSLNFARGEKKAICDKMRWQCDFHNRLPTRSSPSTWWAFY